MPLPLVSSSTGMYYDDELIKDPVAEDIEGSSLSLGMILGIVGGVTAIIVIIIYVCYKCRNNKVDNAEFAEKPLEMLPDQSGIHGPSMAQNQSSFLRTT